MTDSKIVVSHWPSSALGVGTQIKLISVDKGLEVLNENSGEIEFSEYFNGGKKTTTGEGIYLSRKKDLFMDSSKYIDPKEIIYLFKLKWFICYIFLLITAP